MKLLITLSFLLLSYSAFTQSEPRLKTSFDLIMMTKALNNNDFFHDLKEISSMKISQPLNYLGLSITSSFKVNRRSSFEGGYDFDGYLEYLHVIPQRITIQDSIEGKINGFNVGMTLAGIDLIKKERFDLITSVGFNTGRVWMNGADDIKQKNPYFTPMVVVVPRVCIGRISIQLRCAYDFDITNKNWKRKGFSDAALLELDKFSYSGLNLSVGVGYVLGSKPSDTPR